MSGIKTKNSGNGKLSDRMAKKHGALRQEINFQSGVLKSVFDKVSRLQDVVEVLVDEITVLRSVIKRSQGHDLTEAEGTQCQEYDTLMKDGDGIKGECEDQVMYDEVQDSNESA